MIRDWRIWRGFAPRNLRAIGVLSQIFPCAFRLRLSIPPQIHAVYGTESTSGRRSRTVDLGESNPAHLCLPARRQSEYAFSAHYTKRFGGAGWLRSSDHRFNGPGLYQLSYIARYPLRCRTERERRRMSKNTQTWRHQ